MTIYNELEAGTLYHILISAYNDINWSINKLEETEITAGTPYRAYAGQGSSLNLFRLKVVIIQ